MEESIMSTMTKDEALKISANILAKMVHNDNPQPDTLAYIAYIHTAEADKDYGKMWLALDQTKKFIEKLQIALIQK